MKMEIDQRLNLVLAVEEDEGQIIYVHSTPIGRPVYEANYRLITKTMVTMVTDDLGTGGQIRVASLYLRDAAKELDGPGGSRYQEGADALLLEINRLSNVWMPGAAGWETIPYQDALQKKMLTEDQVSEVTNALVYFTAASWFNRASERKSIYKMLENYDARIGSWDSMAFGRSLPTSTTDESSGATAAPSLIPH